MNDTAQPGGEDGDRGSPPGRPDRGSGFALALTCGLAWWSISYFAVAVLAGAIEICIVGGAIALGAIVSGLLYRHSAARDQRPAAPADPYLRADATWRPFSARFRLHPIETSAAVAGIYCAAYTGISSIGPLLRHQNWVHPAAYALVAVLGGITWLVARTLRRHSKRA